MNKDTKHHLIDYSGRIALVLLVVIVALTKLTHDYFPDDADTPIVSEEPQSINDDDAADSSSAH